MPATTAEEKHTGNVAGMWDQVAGLMADLKISVGSVRDKMDDISAARNRLLQNVGPFAPQSQNATVTAGGALTIGLAEVLGPRTGKLWDVHRISIGGNLASPTTTPSPSQPSVPATGVAQQNTNAYPVSVAIAANGATITNVSVNGITVGTAAGTYTVPAYGSISIAYTVATPTWVWSGIASTVAAYVPVYKSATAAAAGATYQNFLCQILIGGTQVQTFGKGQCVVRAGETLMVSATGLASGQIGVLTVEGIEIAAPFVGEYFI